MQQGIIVLEGADSSGKTTLAKALCERFDGHYIHATVTEDAFTHHTEKLREAVQHSSNKLVVLDRLWISEHIYGPIMRGVSQHNLAARCIDRVLMKHAAIYVLCVPSDIEHHVELFRNGKAVGKDEYPENSHIRDIIRSYQDFTHGYPGKSGNLYADQITREGGFLKRFDAILYDLEIMIVDPRRMKHFEDELISILADHREEQYPPALEPARTNLTGHANEATHIFVGEALGPKEEFPWPFFARDSFSSGAAYLNAAIHAAELDETKLLFSNAKIGTATQSFNHLRQFTDGRLKFIALGKVAEDVLKRQGVRPYELPHPQYVRRFRHDDFDKYVKAIKEAVQ